MGIAVVHADDTALEVAVDSALLDFAAELGADLTCETCLAFQGDAGLEPRTDTSWSLRKLSIPGTIVSIGMKGDPPVSAYYFGSNSTEAALKATSYCRDASPTYGRLTNAWGR